MLAHGASFAVAHEIALKLAETAALPSLADSTAEFWHGPPGLAKITETR